MRDEIPFESLIAEPRRYEVVQTEVLAADGHYTLS
jgi:hypothetical protein